MTPLKRIGAIGGIGLGVATGLAGLGAVAALRRPLPPRSGTLRLPGLTAHVEVLRDQWGVPHLYAASNADLFMAQGYVHAQDRLWQMELQRRAGQGRLAEAFGARALEADRFLRVLGFGRVARREAALLEGDAAEAVNAYVRGVNAYIAQHKGRLPIEFTLLRLRPRPWEAADVLAFGKIMALNLSENWALEILRARIVAAVDAERAAALEPAYLDDHPLTIPAGVRYGPTIGEAALSGAAAAAPFTGGAEMGQGSNSWAVGGQRSASGRPLLASDPHLAIQMPSLWYENHLVGGDYAVSGATIPGAPGVVIGHNARIAWGITNALTDTQDLYLERFNPADPTRYEYRGQWEQAELVREEIAVRGRREPVVEEVRLTRHGPVVSPLVAGEGAEQPLALRWTALEPGRIVDAVLGLNRATDWASFRAALADWTAPPQNFIYADVDGHIGYTLGGAMPLRAAGDGRLPVPGWSGEYEWTGTIPTDALPHALDPAEGYVVSANNRIAASGYPYPLPAEWMPGYRAARIRALIEETPRHDAASFARIHGDQRSLPGLSFAALAARLPGETALARRARETLASWDGEVSVESVAGTLYARLCQKLLHGAYAEVAGPLGVAVGLGFLAVRPGPLYLLRALPGVLRRALARDDAWLPEGRDWDGLLGEAWEQTLAELRREYGDDLSTWRYGRGHALALRHPLGEVPLLRPLFNRGPFPTGGDFNTVCLGYQARTHAGDQYYVAPSYRQICDTSDWDRSLSIHPIGQSGQPASPHYADFIQLWLATRYHPMPWSRERVEEYTTGHLALTP